MRIQTTPRPYVLICEADGYPQTRFLLTSTDAQRIIDDDTDSRITNATPNRVDGEDADGMRWAVVPATIGGGDAFRIDA